MLEGGLLQLNRFIFLLLFLAGCSTPVERMNEFMRSYGHEPVEVKYNWSIYPKFPYTLMSDPPVIYIDTHMLHKAEHLHTQILKHEACHAMGLIEHCKKPWCLMYYKMDVWPIHIFDKPLCKECEACLWQHTGN